MSDDVISLDKVREARKVAEEKKATDPSMVMILPGYVLNKIMDTDEFIDDAHYLCNREDNTIEELPELELEFEGEEDEDIDS